MIFKEISPNIYAVEAKTQKELAQTFLRFQEHYESPYFKDKIFTLEEFIPWYKQFTKKEKFTYYKDWEGFNVPNYVFNEFFNGSFDPLTKKEQWLLNKVSKIKSKGSPYYIIGYVKGSKNTKKHEMAHALFYTNPSYFYEVLDALWQSDEFYYKEMDVLDEHLLSMGYHEDTIIDETHAYILCEKTYLKDQGLWADSFESIKKELNRIYRYYK